MKKWMYLVFPGVMLGLFLVFYSTHVKEAELREENAKRVAMEKLEKEKLEKKIAEQRAAEDSAKRQAEREAEEKKKEDDRRRKQEAADKEVRDQTAEYRAEADKSAKLVAQHEITLDKLRQAREQLVREEIEVAKQVELARVAKRTAELQQQRLTQQIATRADSSSMAQLPPPPAKRD